MFYCNDILKKNNGKFGAIWLAAFYGKNVKKILSRRDIARVNIIKACIDVINPQYTRYSLRLQANLMIGITRVYKEQVVYFCNDIKNAWRQLQLTLTAEHLRQMIDLQKPQLSEDACTLADPVLEYYGSDIASFPKDIFTKSPAELFSGDDAFVSVGIFASPLRPSPSRPVWTSRAGASPAKPSPVRTPPFRSPPDAHQAEKTTITMPDIEDTGEPPIQIPQEDIIPPPPPDDHETVRTDLLDLPDLTGLLDDQAGFDDADMLPLETGDTGTDLVKILDQFTGELITAQDKEEEKGESGESEMRTPSGAGIEVLTPSPPRKRVRRRQARDVQKKLTDEKIRRNVFDVSSTLRDSIIDPPRRRTAQELFTNPARPELKDGPFFHFWTRNAVTPHLSDDKTFQVVPIRSDLSLDDVGMDEPMEIPRGDDVGHEPMELPSPELLRGDETGEGSAYERSKLSSLGALVTTPETPADGSAIQLDDHDRTPDPGRDQDRSFRHSGLIVPELPPIREISPAGDMPGLSVSPMRASPDIYPIEEISHDDSVSPERRETFKEDLLRILAEEMGEDDETYFHEVCPEGTGTRKIAATIFYHLLEWHSQGGVILSQDGMLQPICIQKGARF